MVLGVNAYCYSSGVALYDGAIQTCLEEERFSREKRTSAFPHLSLAAVAESVPSDEQTLVAHPWAPWRLLREELKLIAAGFPRSLDLFRPGATSVGNAGFALETVVRFKQDLRKHLKGPAPEILYVSHHHAHAALAFFGSPFDQAMVVVCDGFGDQTALSVWSGRGTRLTREYQAKLPASLGMLYSFVTHHLGYRFGHDEGKVMALAALGGDAFKKDFAQIVRPRADGTLNFDFSYLNYHRSAEIEPFTKKFIHAFGPARRPDEPLERRHFDLAAALQETLEQSLLHVARVFSARLGMDNVALAGGVALNCVTNARIEHELNVDQVYVPPNPDDGGAALGAAMWVHHRVLGRERGEPISRADYGTDISEPSIRHALRGRQTLEMEHPELLAAELLAAGHVVGWCQGRMEMGPRALGNRSILADPRGPDVQRRLNDQIKHREAYRPFAPAILDDQADAWFPGCPSSPFMSFAAAADPTRADQIPAVLHVDGTARVQTVSPQRSPRFHALIAEFARRTNVPMVLNTSLNDREPICRTAEEARDCFDRAGLDALFIGNHLIVSPELESAPDGPLSGTSRRGSSSDRA